MKFKVGDRVKVTSNSRFDVGKFAGEEGVVIEVIPSWQHPYRVEFEKLPPCHFHANELEKVEG